MTRYPGRITVAGLLATTLMSTSALAQDGRTQWYGVFAGLSNMPSDSEASLQSSGWKIEGDLDLSNEFGLAFALGVEMGGGRRLELEAARRSSDIDGASGAVLNGTAIPAGTYSVTGDVDTWSLMVNFHQDIDAGSVQPYVGAGLGFARHDGTAELMTATGPSGRDSGDDTVFAYQFMAGVGYEISEGMTLFGGYRYMETSDIEIERFTASYGTHAIEAGIRVRF